MNFVEIVKGHQEIFGETSVKLKKAIMRKFGKTWENVWQLNIDFGKIERRIWKL